MVLLDGIFNKKLISFTLTFGEDPDKMVPKRRLDLSGCESKRSGNRQPGGVPAGQGVAAVKWPWLQGRGQGSRQRARPDRPDRSANHRKADLVNRKALNHQTIPTSPDTSKPPLAHTRQGDPQLPAKRVNPRQGGQNVAVGEAHGLRFGRDGHPGRGARNYGSRKRSGVLPSHGKRDTGLLPSGRRD